MVCSQFPATQKVFCFSASFCFLPRLNIYERESPRAVPIVLLTSMSIIASASSWDPGVAEAAALFAAS